MFYLDEGDGVEINFPDEKRKQWVIVKCSELESVKINGIKISRLYVKEITVCIAHIIFVLSESNVAHQDNTSRLIFKLHPLMDAGWELKREKNIKPRKEKRC